MYRIRGKYIWIDNHAYDGMHAEKPPIKLEHLYETISNPDKIIMEAKPRVKALKWIGKRSIIVYYDEYEVDIYVRSISATRRKIV